MICPLCQNACDRDSADVGVGTMYGPWGCYCGWSEDERFNVSAGPKYENGYRVDSRGGLTPEPTAPPAVDHPAHEGERP